MYEVSSQAGLKLDGDEAEQASNARTLTLFTNVVRNAPRVYSTEGGLKR